MRIIHVSDCFAPSMGGIETQVSHLAERQHMAGDGVTVLTCSPDVDNSDGQRPYRVIRSVWPNPVGAPVDPRAPRRFLAMIEKLQPDVVHLHQGELTPVVQALMPRLAQKNIPSVVTVHSVWNPTTGIPLMKLFASAGKLPGPILFAGVSNLVRGRVAQVMGEDNVQVLPNGVDTGQWAVEPVSHEGLHVAVATRFAPRKRVPALLRMLQHAGSQAVIAGEGPGLPWARRYVAKHRLPISLPGRLSADQLRALYAESDVFIAPGYAEAASIAAAEAQAAGLAILSRSQSGLGERISSQEGAVAATDVEMAEILRQWTEEPERLLPIKKYNREHRLALDWQEVLPQTYECYRRAQQRFLA